MSTTPRPRPTEAELELLSVLWARGPSSVRQIHEALGPDKTTGYTTTLKILQRMLEKGLLRRDERQRTHVYEAVWRAEETQRQLVRDLLRPRRFTVPPANWSCRPSPKRTSRPKSWPRSDGSSTTSQPGSRASHSRVVAPRLDRPIRTDKPHVGFRPQTSTTNIAFPGSCTTRKRTK